jgi:hypothetical protein
VNVDDRWPLQTQQAAQVRVSLVTPNRPTGQGQSIQSLHLLVMDFVPQNLVPAFLEQVGLGLENTILATRQLIAIVADEHFRTSIVSTGFVTGTSS